MVMRSCACLARSSVSFCGFAPLRSIPISCMAASTSGWTRSPGSVPAETAFARCGSAKWLKKAAALGGRPALWTQAKITLNIGSPSTQSYEQQFGPQQALAEDTPGLIAYTFTLAAAEFTSAFASKSVNSSCTVGSAPKGEQHPVDSPIVGEQQPD